MEVTDKKELFFSTKPFYLRTAGEPNPRAYISKHFTGAGFPFSWHALCSVPENTGADTFATWVLSDRFSPKGTNHQKGKVSFILKW